MNAIQKRALTIVMLLIGLLTGCQDKIESGEEVPSGDYIGLEEMGDASPDGPNSGWYHENTLTVRGNSVALNQVPVTISNNEKAYSASDGGFYNFEGTLEKSQGKYFARLTLTHHDYAPVPVKIINEADTSSELSLAEGIENRVIAPKIGGKAKWE